ncbi:hypothetical protein SNE510_64710 [Streptomyces sp. NE5-10]|nr:hypothetical protein SNE510_64710 [Streptomyces sp. NE5-10]
MGSGAGWAGPRSSASGVRGMGSSGRSGPGDGSAGRVLAALPGAGSPVRLPDAVLTPAPATLDAFVTGGGREHGGEVPGPGAARAVRQGGSSGRTAGRRLGPSTGTPKGHCY